MKLRDYQVDIANKAKSTLAEHGMVYISAQVRTGKTLMSLETARLYGATNVLFLTKKKAISSIKKDYFDFSYNDCFNLSVCNDESMHKIEEPSQYDLIIHDEHHRFGSFPKPGKYTTMYKKLFKHKKTRLPEWKQLTQGCKMVSQNILKNF
jgi:superfamily II DNA or RNA helicase